MKESTRLNKAKLETRRKKYCLDILFYLNGRQVVNCVLYALNKYDKTMETPPQKHTRGKKEVC